MSKKVDVLIVTFNSSRTLATCLKQVRNFIPFNRILVGDGGSRDETVEIARKMGAQVYNCKENMIGRNRYRLAERAETEWVLYIDSDTYVYPNFWKTMSRYMRNGVGMVMATQDEPSGASRKYCDWAYRRMGFCAFGDTLAPRRLILECTELFDLHTGEDPVYASFVKHRNYKVVEVYEHLSYHDKTLYEFYGSMKRSGTETGQRRSLKGLLWREAFSLRNIIWFILEKRPKGVEVLERVRCLLEVYKGFMEGLRLPGYTVAEPGETSLFE
jgi:glycosyltransferase involved in cell wall biosynthesis